MFRRTGTYERETREKMKDGPGAVTLEHLFKKDDFGGSHFRVCAKLILPPGSGIGLHPHIDEDEVYIVLKGSGTVTDAGLTAEVKPGDTVLTGKGDSHCLTNTGSEVLEVIAIVVTY